MKNEENKVGTLGEILSYTHSGKVIPFDRFNLSKIFLEELNKLPNDIVRGWAIEFVIACYFMCILKYKLFDCNLKHINGILKIRTGIKGKADIIFHNNKGWRVGSCKLSKTGEAGLEYDGLKAFVDGNPQLSPCEYFGAVYLNAKLSKTKFKKIFNKKDIDDMWEELYYFFERHNFSFQEINEELLSKKEVLMEKFPHQKYLLNQILDKFEIFDDVYLNAIMRSGKSYIAGLVISYLKCNKVLFISHYPTNTFDEIVKIYNNYEQFDKHKVIELKDGVIKLDEKGNKYIEIENKTIIISSAQFLKCNPDVLKDVDFDLIIIDEAHTGFDAPVFSDVLKNLKSENTKRLYMSGTMENIKLFGNVDPEQIVEWTYQDVQDAKKSKCDKLKEYDYIGSYNNCNSPMLKIMNLSPEVGLRNNLKKFDLEETEQTWTKIYNIKDVLKQIVKELLLDGFEKKNYGIENKYLPETKGFSIINNVGQMFAWFCPDTNAQDKLKEVIEEIQKEYPKSKLNGFKVELFNSDNGDFRTSIKKLEEPKYKNKTLLILCGQGTVGITYKDLPLVIIGRDIGSVDLYLQIAFRVMSPMDVVKDRYVIDLSFGHKFVYNILGLIRNLNRRDELNKAKMFFDNVMVTLGLDRLDVEKFFRMKEEFYTGREDWLLKQISNLVPFDVDFFMGKISSAGKGMETGEKTKGKNSVPEERQGKSTEEKELTEQEKLERRKIILRTILKELVIGD